MGVIILFVFNDLLIELFWTCLHVPLRFALVARARCKLGSAEGADNQTTKIRDHGEGPAPSRRPCCQSRLDAKVDRAGISNQTHAGINNGVTNTVNPLSLRHCTRQGHDDRRSRQAVHTNKQLQTCRYTAAVRTTAILVSYISYLVPPKPATMPAPNPLPSWVSDVQPCQPKIFRSAIGQQFWTWLMVHK